MFRHFLLWHGSLVASLYVPKGKMSGVGELLNSPNREADEPIVVLRSY